MKTISLLLIYFTFFGFNLFAQKHADDPFENYILTGIKGKTYDTLAYQTGQRIIKETQGLLEKEIDPKSYILGPQDVLLISIVTSNPKEFEVEVSPDGRIVIPQVGIIDVKNESLEKAEKSIIQKVKSIFRATEINVVLKNIRKFKVSVSGAVQKSAIVSATSTDRVSEVIDKCGGFKENASLRKIRLIRSNDKEIFEVDLFRYFLLHDKNANPTVTGGDHIIVPFVSENEYIEISGEVNKPGKFEYTTKDSLSTLIRFAHGFTQLSFLDSVEFVRMIGPDKFETKILDLRSWANSILSPTANLANNFPLNLGDRVFVRRVPKWKKPKTATIEGEVVFPGKYAIDETTTTLMDLIQLCGGFTAQADIERGRFIRQALLDIVDPEMERLSRIPPSEMSKNELRYFQSKVSERKGLISVNFQRLLQNPSSDDNILLQDKDSIFVPKKNEFVNVQGRVNNPGLIAYKPGYSYLDYINLAGGFGFRADKKATFIVKTKGEQFLAEDFNYKIEPGDNILVPPTEEKTFFEIFTTTLTIITQILTIAGVVIAIMRVR